MGLFQQIKPTHVVCEDYRVYAEKAGAHIGKSLFTPKLIGKIDLLCNVDNIPVTYQMAATAKVFCTNDKLKEWGFYQESMRHSRDAIRHACYYILFNGRGKKS